MSICKPSIIQSWNPNGYNSCGQFISFQRRRDLPVKLTYGLGNIATLCYITEEQYQYLRGLEKGHDQLTPYDVYFYDKKRTRFADHGARKIGETPLYWNNTDDKILTRLMYLTNVQRSVLIESDIHDTGLNYENTLYGPNKIISFHGNDPDELYGVGNTFNGSFRDGIPPISSEQLVEKNTEKRSSGVYRGSLSSLGNMVAESLNKFYGFVKVTQSGEGYQVGDIIPLHVFQKLVYKEESLIAVYNSFLLRGQPTTLKAVSIPFSTGYFRTYWTDPTRITLGSDSAIPAITGVIPDNFTDDDGKCVIDFQGSLVFYIDIQIQRATGNNTWDNKKFAMKFGQILGAIGTHNRFISASNNAKKPLEVYGASTMVGMATQNFDKFKKGINCVSSAFNNLGKVAKYLPEGKSTNGKWVGFGTPNSIVKCLAENKLVDIVPDGTSNTLSDEILLSGVDFSDVYNPDYTERLRNLLTKVTNKKDLEIIQNTLGSRINEFTSILDYLDIEKVSGLPNTTDFENFEEMGEYIGINNATLQIEDGSSFVSMLSKVEVPENMTAVNEVKGKESTLKIEDIANIKNKLLKGKNNQPVTILDVIGTVSGSHLDNLKIVNQKISELYATSYGERVRDLLTELSVYTPDNFENQKNAKIKIKEYKNLLLEISQSEETSTIVKKLNETYLTLCRDVYREFKNYCKLELQESTPDSSTILNFVAELPNYGKDTENLGTDLFLYQVTNNNSAGDRIKAILGKGKTDDALSLNGIQRKNTL